ncbi:MAG: glucuronate isomerase [Leeuwenhoekiella sp.]
MKTKKFITDNFVLQSEYAQKLYHDYAKDLPIIDYHNHLSANKIAENKPLGNITEAWLSEDHYKWRGMRANGVDEKFITGETTTPKEKFIKWAETVPYTVRNPLFHWTHLELKCYFDIDEILQPSNAEAIYDRANAILKDKTPAQLLEDLKVEIVCTTDDPADDLKYHGQIANGNYKTRVFPTFRSDALFNIDRDTFLSYLTKLAESSGIQIDDLSTFLKSIDKRIAFFNDNGCRISDFGLGKQLRFEQTSTLEAERIFDKKMRSEPLSQKEVDQYRSYLFVYLGKKYHDFDWVQQFHLGPLRNNNSRLVDQVGLDAGVDSIGDFTFGQFMSNLFNTLESNNKLTKTITYNLNPSDNEVFATMMGNFQSSDFPGKMQWGSGWWFLDQKEGMERQINCLSNMGLLSRFIGMLTDSRSFLSFPRHDYFRRILCNLIGEDMKQGLLPDDIEFLGKMVQDICYFNAKNYFGFTAHNND